MNKSESVINSEITIRKRKDIFEGWGLGVAGDWGGGLKDEHIIRQENHSVDTLHLSP